MFQVGTQYFSKDVNNSTFSQLGTHAGKGKFVQSTRRLEFRE